MIESKLSRVMGDRRVNMLELSRATGIGRSTIFRLYHNQSQQIDLGVLDKLCDYLDCDIADILVRGPNVSQAEVEQKG